CCISTGEFHFPRREAAEIAVKTVKEYLNASPGLLVVFNVFTEEDHKIYHDLLRPLKHR
ncbi:MAG: protein-ADP-ribose hydrolase, partial [Ruthenibacterium lactatiformans]|nr:protein-ADP-ribose hydrolase [Ruthenibacterium lactatiformans]